MATTGYKRGIEGADIDIIYQKELIRGQNPDSGGTGGTWKIISATGFSPNFTQDRETPDTIRADKQSEPSVLSTISCAPQIVVPFTFNQFDDFLAALLNNDQFSAEVCQNSTVFESFYLITRIPGTDTNFAYPGAWPNGGQLTLASGGFGSFQFDYFAQERINVAESVIVDPIGAKDNNPIISASTLGMGITWNSTPMAGLTNIVLSHSKTNSQQLYEIGSASDQGIVMGSLMIELQAQLYFQDESHFLDFRNQTEGPILVSIRDKNNKGYDINMPNGIIKGWDDPIQGSGIIIATADFEAWPSPYTISYTRIP